MKEILLPPCRGNEERLILPSSSQVTIVGANGAGKTKFMGEMIDLCGERAFSLSALDAMIPRSDKGTGVINTLYDEKCYNKKYIRQESVSELDKLAFLLITEEFEHLIKFKIESQTNESRQVKAPVTRLDKLIELWEKIFPGNRVLHEAGEILFATTSGENVIGFGRLSQGERAVFYYIAGVLYAPKDSVIFIDSPSLFLHPSIQTTLWNSIESLRPDCRFVYNSVDMDFITSRGENVCIWVKRYYREDNCWDYTILEHGTIPEDLFSVLLGNRKPVLFIEGDSKHSIDIRLYSLVFPDYTIRPLGSCNKVIESVRSFNDLKLMHKLDSKGIVDRDRRTENEVAYLRKKNILVPEVAEVENMFLLEEVIRIMASRRRCDAEKVFKTVKLRIMTSFRKMIDKQALEHVRHRVKRDVERRIDARFTCITALELHLNRLNEILKPRETYTQLRRHFYHLLDMENYSEILKVFNHKPLLSEVNLAGMLNYNNPDHYISDVMNCMKQNTSTSRQLREAFRACFKSEEIMEEITKRPNEISSGRRNKSKKSTGKKS